MFISSDPTTPSLGLGRDEPQRWTRQRKYIGIENIHSPPRLPDYPRGAALG
jgi:hypothetical protein